MKKQSLNSRVIQNNHKLPTNDLSKMANKTCEKRQLGFMISKGVVLDDIHWDDEILVMFEESFGNNQ